MSAEAMLWSRKLLPLLANDAQRLILMDFSWRANSDGLLWPTIAVISMELGKSDRAIRRAIRELDGEEILNVNADFRNDGSQGSNYYQLLLNLTPQELLKRRKARSGTVIMSTSARKRFEQRMERFYGFIECWAESLTAIRNEINPRTFDTWYTPLKFRGVNKRSLILGVPNEHFETYFKDGRTRRLILDAVKAPFEAKGVTIVTVLLRHDQMK
jgi:hypothetical protein